MYPFSNLFQPNPADQNDDQQLSNLQRIMRLQNIFGGQQSVPGQTNDQIVQPSNNYDQMLQKFTPQTEMLDRYKQALQNQPIRQDPGKMRTIAAIMGGLGAGAGPAGIVGGSPVGFKGNSGAAFETSNAIANMPFNQQTTDWQNQVKNLGEGARLEESMNVAGAKNVLAQGAQEIARDRNQVQRERTEFLRDKSSQIYDFKINELQQKSDQAAQRADLAERTLSQRAYDASAARELNQARIDAMIANHNLDVAIRQKNLDETKRLHDEQIKKMQAENDNLRSLIQNRGASTQTDTTVTDAKGEVVGKKSTTTRKGDFSQQAISGDEDKRQRAIKILRDSNKLVNEDTIKRVMDQLR